MKEEVLEQGFPYSDSGIYTTPQTGDLNFYKNTLTKFPEYELPEVFGMHDNANITFELKESKTAINTILSI